MFLSMTDVKQEVKQEEPIFLSATETIECKVIALTYLDTLCKQDMTREQLIEIVSARYPTYSKCNMDLVLSAFVDQNIFILNSIGKYTLNEAELTDQ